MCERERERVGRAEKGYDNSWLTWTDWAIWVTNPGGSFKSFTVRLANTATSESGSTAENTAGEDEQYLEKEFPLYNTNKVTVEVSIIRKICQYVHKQKKKTQEKPWPTHVCIHLPNTSS